jgi:prolyl-tRNA synthetase
MQAEELAKFFNGPAGFLGPVGLKPNAKPLEDGLTVVVDKSLEGRKNLVAGANKLDYHLRNVVPGRDFSWTLQPKSAASTRAKPAPIEGCSGKLVVGKAVEVGHIFKLGRQIHRVHGRKRARRERQGSNAHHGQLRHRHRAHSHRAIEQSNDKNGFWLPASIAPFTVVVTVTNVSDAALRETGEKLAAELEAAGLDVLLDDRDERAGVKFKDADLVGIPYRINVGKKAAGGQVELVTRSTASSVDVALDAAVALVKERVQEDALLLSTEDSL